LQIFKFLRFKMIWCSSFEKITLGVKFCTEVLALLKNGVKKSKSSQKLIWKMQKIKALKMEESIKVIFPVISGRFPSDVIFSFKKPKCFPNDVIILLIFFRFFGLMSRFYVTDGKLMITIIYIFRPVYPKFSRMQLPDYYGTL